MVDKSGEEVWRPKGRFSSGLSLGGRRSARLGMGAAESQPSVAASEPGPPGRAAAPWGLACLICKGNGVNHACWDTAEGLRHQGALGARRACVGGEAVVQRGEWTRAPCRRGWGPPGRMGTLFQSRLLGNLGLDSVGGGCGPLLL